MTAITSTTTPVVPPMSASVRLWVGLGNFLGSIVAFVALLATYGFAEQVMAAQSAAQTGAVVTQKVTWWGPDFPASMGMAVLMVGAAAAAVGSMIQQSKIFAERAGHESLQRGWVWWYVLRPFWSALLGAVAVVALDAGVIKLGDQSTSSTGLTVLVTAGFIAGLFTDQVLQKLRSALGATDPVQLATAPAS